MPRHATGRRRKRDPLATVWILKVTLTTKPAVWRTIAIRSDQTLDDLHEVLFEAFDRFDEHMYSFHRQPLFARRGPDFNRGNVEYTSPVLIEEADPFGERDVRDASRTRMDELEFKQGDKFYYLFDFGDSWWHELTVEQTGQPLQPAYQYPFIMEKHGVSPPQYEYPTE